MTRRDSQQRRAAVRSTTSRSISHLEAHSNDGTSLSMHHRDAPGTTTEAVGRFTGNGRRREAVLVTALLATMTMMACDMTAEGRAASAQSTRYQTRESASAAVRTAEDSDDPAVRAALAALAEDRPYRATQLLVPALAASDRRTPEVVLLAATASARWSGWREVEQLLDGEPWLDQLGGGEGRELLARAALERRENVRASTEAARAVAAAPTDSARGIRLTLLARALDRRDVLDSAATAYTAAARLLPRAADWLLLRAAGVTADSASRASILASLRDSLALRRAPVVEAQALARVGDTLAAATAYERAGDRAAGLRLRLLVARDSASRKAVRRDLAALVAVRGNAEQSRAAATQLAGFSPLTAAEALAVARTLDSSGPLSTAANAYARVASTGTLAAADRLSYARVLFRLGRYEDAATQFARVPPGSPEAGAAAYERGRALLRAGRLADSRAVLRTVESGHPRDTAAIGRALFLLSDLATDENRDDDARRTFRYLVERYPTSAMAPPAAFQAAIIAMAQRQPRVAAAELDALASRYPSSADATGALYWSGRALQQAGDSASARSRWRDVVRRDSLSYYAVLASRRLGTAAWAPPAGGGSHAASGVDSLFGRLDILEAVGFGPEVGWERNRISGEAATATSRMLAVAEQFELRGRSTNAITLGRRALGAGAPADARTYRVIYPLVHQKVLVAEAGANDLDPALVAALIRQESNFLATALSPAGARGLMQLMPTVGRAVARGAGVAPWNDALLFQPDVNMRLGTIHLATLMRQYDELAHVLAAYNAGGSRVARWLRKGGAGDPELFTERIPFAETRDYVRIVTRNREFYRSLYGW